MELPRFGGRLRVVDLPVHGRQGLDPAFDARRQPVHRRPAAAADTEKKAQADHQGPEPRAPQEHAHPCGRRRRIGLDGTQRAACDGAQALAEPLELAVGRLLDLPPVGLQPGLVSGGQVTRRWADRRRARPIAKARRCGEDDPARRHPTGATMPAIVAGSTRGPSLRLPIGNQSRREDGGYIQTGLEGEHPASSGTPRALETIGIHLKIALGLSNDVGPPQKTMTARSVFSHSGRSTRPSSKPRSVRSTIPCCPMFRKLI